MKNEMNKPGKMRLRGFGTALLISLAMIGAACAYAYQATNTAIENELDSLQNDLNAESTQSTYETQMQTETETVTESFHEVYDAAADVKPESETETEPQTDSDTESEPEPAEEFDHVKVMPIEGEVQQEFSGGELVKSATTGTWQTHNGTDIAAAEETSVCAIDNGTVAEVTKDALWGVCVTIDHGNGIKSRYCGLSASLTVTEGDAVESGQVIGSVGTTADIECRQEPHLHFEVLKNDVYVDPMEYVQGE
ncbi:MAG: peptidoglycan DD-metalloendopeptidase family protein [Ruminococcus sp.]